MSIECDICGKELVDNPGQWCNECQEKEFFENEKSDAIWYSASRLCQICIFAWGPDPGDICSAYHMPLYMVKRKFKCKNFWEDRS